MEKNEFDLGLGYRRALSVLFGNLSILLAVMTLAVAATVFFTDVHFTTLFDSSFSLSFFILLFCSVVMYYCMSDVGHQAGLATEVYQKSEQAYEKIRAEVKSEGGGGLYAFCKERVKAELESARAALLLPYENGESSKAAERARRRAAALRPRALTPAMLLDGGRPSRRECLTESPTAHRRRTGLLSLLPGIIGSFFTVSAVFEVIAAPGIATVAACLLKLLAILYNGVKGYGMGYENAATVTVAYNDCRTRLLTAYLRERRPADAVNADG